MIKTKKRVLIILLYALACSVLIWWFWPAKSLFREVAFNQLPGWSHAEFKKSLIAFQISCRAFVKEDPETVVGTELIDLRVKDWQPACLAALKLQSVDGPEAKLFFQQWFYPVAFDLPSSEKGLFTGYYMPLVHGSMTQSPEFNIPVYEVPNNLITVDLASFFPDLKNRKLVGRLEHHKLVPFYTREQINKGAIADTAQVLFWINDPVDRLFLEIQGSGIVEFQDGKKMYIGYDGQNGLPYTAMAGVLIKKGVMTREKASMQAIKEYLEAHPEQRDEIMNQNQSFVFFRKLSLDGALGSQGVVLTPGYSLAVDKAWIPLGAPLWLNTSRPDHQKPGNNKPMQRLMIAQDTGGAIRGKVRGDVFWGAGNKATLIAGYMKNEGQYWLLLPRHAVNRLNARF